jgi:chemotaxis signal transduction protein
MFANTVSNQWSELTTPTALSVELISFEIDQIKFGMPIAKIERIISNIHLDQDYTLAQHIEIIDLQDLTTGIPITNPTAIVIFTDNLQRSCGIPINTVPELITLPLDRIRLLPQEFRNTNPLGIASHLAVISTPEAELTLFILGG